VLGLAEVPTRAAQVARLRDGGDGAARLLHLSHLAAAAVDPIQVSAVAHDVPRVGFDARQCRGARGCVEWDAVHFVVEVGRPVQATQAHFFRFRGAQSIEHVAVRDDLHMMIQLGFIPPNPRVAFKLAWWWMSGQSARAVAAAIGSARDAAASVAA
jgi:hypothetical protein